MWAQPWAWLGLAGLAVPLAIHLLARHQAARAAFPTLRFIDASELNAIRRHRLTDFPLLFVRLLIVALAVAALAGPRFGAAAVAAEEETAHVTVYDMTTSAAAGRSDSFIEGPRRAHLRTESLAAGVDAAIAWAAAQPGAREITVVSDFQRGALDDAVIRRVPKGIGLKFERVASTPAPMPAGLSVDAAGVRMAWPADAAVRGASVAALAGPDQAAAERLLAAVGSVTPWPAATVTLVFPKAPERADVAAAMTSINQPWMFAATARALERWPSRILAGARAGGLVILIGSDPSTLEAAEIAASISAGLHDVVPVSESDPRTIPDEQLQRWERAPEPATLRRAGEPQGRWLWMGVVALLAVETWMRRRAS